MLKIRIEGNKVVAEAAGDLKDMIVETMLAVYDVYRGIKDSNPLIADVYKAALIDALRDDECPTWTHNPTRNGVSIKLPKDVLPAEEERC